MNCRSVSAPFGWRCLSTPPCSVSCNPSKIPYIGFSHSTAPNRPPSSACPWLGAFCGLAVSPALCRGATRHRDPVPPTGLSAPAHTPVGPWFAAEYGCRLPLRSWKLCVSPRASHGITCGPRALSSAGVMLSPASSVLRPDVPGSVPPHDFALRLYVQPCRSRALPAGAESFLALPIVPSDRAVPHTPQGLRAAYAHSSPGETVFAFRCQARRPGSPAIHFTRARLTRRQDSLHATARSVASPPGGSHLAAARTLSVELSPERSPYPGVHFATR